MVASLLVTCQYLKVILARFWSGHHGQILLGSTTSDLSEPYGNLVQDSGQVTMAKSCLVAPLVTCQNRMVILARFWSGHYGQILPLRLPMNLTRFCVCRSLGFLRCVLSSSSFSGVIFFYLKVPALGLIQIMLRSSNCMLV